MNIDFSTIWFSYFIIFVAGAGVGSILTGVAIVIGLSTYRKITRAA